MAAVATRQNWIPQSTALLEQVGTRWERVQQALKGLEELIGRLSLEKAQGGLINVYKCLMGGMKGRRRVQALPSGVLSALSTEGQGLNDFGVEAAQAPAATATTLKPSSSPLCTCEPGDMSYESF